METSCRAIAAAAATSSGECGTSTILRSGSRILALAAAQGVVADFGVEPELIPLGVTLTDVRVASNDGGADAVRAERIRVRPRFFALLAGKVVLADVELVAPRVRAVISGRRIVNLGIEIPESKKSTDDGPIHVPLETLSISDGTFEVAVDDGATPNARGPGAPPLPAPLAARMVLMYSIT